MSLLPTTQDSEVWTSASTMPTGSHHVVVKWLVADWPGETRGDTARACGTDPTAGDVTVVEGMEGCTGEVASGCAACFAKAIVAAVGVPTSRSSVCCWSLVASGMAVM